MKQRILEWVIENDNNSIKLEHIKQTNIALRSGTFVSGYYFTCGAWFSQYTMKRFLEIADNKLYDRFDHTHGSFHFIKNNEVIN